MILQAKNICKQLGDHQHELLILNQMNLSVQAGETIAIVGASGSGKTTFLSILAGLDVPTTGEIYLKNQPLHQLTEDQRSAVRAQHVGFIFQQFLLVQSLTALENVMLPAELAGMANAKQQAEQLLAQVGLAERGDHYPNQLSGGEQQRVAIARAFITQPDILFADEPTGNLDSNTGEHIIELLFQLNQQHGTTLVLVTHDKNLAQRCQRQVQIKAGELAQEQVNYAAEVECNA